MSDRWRVWFWGARSGRKRYTTALCGASWLWREWTEGGPEPSKYGKCKRLSDARRRCEKHAGRKLEWKVVGCDRRGKDWAAGMQREGGGGKTRWAWWVIVGYSGKQGLEQGRLKGFAASAEAAKRRADGCLQILRNIPMRRKLKAALARILTQETPR